MSFGIQTNVSPEEEKSNALGYIKVGLEFDGLRSDPRYAALLKKMGLRQ